MEAYCWVMHCFPQAPKSIDGSSKPALLVVDILHGAFPGPPEQRKAKWFVSVGCGSGNVAMGARLFGFSVIAMDTEDRAIALTKSRVWRTHDESWLSAFKETVPKAARNRIDSAMDQYVPRPVQSLLALPAPASQAVMTEIDTFTGAAIAAAGAESTDEDAAPPAAAAADEL